ncbi:MAG TPA: L,D-transpeptidase family protein [Roseiarcus sp.]
MKSRTWRARVLAACLATNAGALLAGCQEQLDSSNTGTSAKSLRPISQQTLTQMEALGTTASSPTLIRTYKKEAEFEIWKKKSDGQYALLKTFPMCRWSGQLGPKLREGDHQVPEGFYTIMPGQMNPNSAYYLSFNVGYPNAFDRAWDRTGGTIMVHGICSSAGCYSMTDAQIAEIYAIARESFNGGQREIQMQSYPFKMTAENLAKHRLDPNIDFWKQLKNGSDHFEVTKAETPVLVCGKRYVFGAHADGEVSPREPCPTLRRDRDVESQVAEKRAKDDEAVAALVAKGVKPIRLVYQDGGQNPFFTGKVDDVSAPEALLEPPREIALDNSGKPIPEVVKVANASAESRPTPSRGHMPAVETVRVAANSTTVATTPDSAAGAAPSPLAFVADGSKSWVKNLFKAGGDAPPAPVIQVFEPEQPIPTDVPLPPRRSALLDSPVRMAALPAAASAKPAADTNEPATQ